MASANESGMQGVRTPKTSLGRGRARTPLSVSSPGNRGWEHVTPPPSYHTSTPSQSVDLLTRQLDLICHNLESNCSLLESFLPQGVNESQASMLANTIGEGLQNLERQEYAVLGAGGAVGGDPLVTSNNLKARARHLLLLCHAQINPVGSSRGSDKFGLPKVKLPNYDGKLSEWHNFWNLFKSLIDSRTDLTPIVKFNYLIQSLSKEPLDIVKGVLVTEENYPTALSLLEQRYGNPDKIRQALFQQFRTIKSPKHNFSDLMAFNISVQQLVTQITGKRPSADLQDCIKSLIIEKLPTQTCDLIALRYQRCTYTYRELIEGIQFVIDMFEFNSTKAGETTVVNTIADKAPKAFHGKQPSVNINSTKYKIQCRLCSGEHREQDCPKFNTRDNIRDRVNRLNLCYNCFSNKHRVNACPSRYSCRNCHNRHHTLLCAGIENQTQRRAVVESNSSRSQQQTNAQVASGAFNNTNQNVAQMNATNNVTNPNLVVNGNSSNILQNNVQPSSSNASQNGLNVVVSLFNCQNVNELPSAALPTAKFKVAYGNSSCLSRALVDSGSQKSFISKTLANKLNLPVIAKVCLNLNTFGSGNIIQEFEVVKARIQLGKVKVNVKLIVHENVNTPVHNPGILQIQRKFNQKGIIMADRNIKSETMDDIDLLIGVD